ncbi:MAG: DUF47 domain-containing protein [Candidatus Heimdallarchaeota archaeon]
MVLQTNGNNVEKKVLDIILDHARLVLGGSEALSYIVDCWKTPGREEFKKNVDKLDLLESKANSLKRSAMKELSTAGGTLLFRQDLMRIVRSIDQIIDLGQGAAFFLNQMDSEWIPANNIAKDLQELTDKMVAVTKLLSDLIRGLFQSLDKVMGISEQIEILENKADANYRSLIIAIAHMEDGNSHGMLLREAIDRIEDMIDSARDVASTVRIYAMSR